jgi:hypothetical protein
VQFSGAELNVGNFRFAPVALHTTLTNGLLNAALSRIGMYGGQMEGTATVDVSAGTPGPTWPLHRRWQGTAPKIFTPDEYKTIIRCLHPDANPPTASQK